MSSNTIAISIKDISKCFELYKKPIDQLKQLTLPKLRRILGIKTGKYFEEFWALNNINIQIFQGEAVGLVGLNGSGKSTLLQIIAGTLTPSTGEVRHDGEVGALLELGAGLNHELTGRENIYLNGALQGFDELKINKKLQEILDFSEIGDKIDLPIKSYSSGMQMRLAFAVATAFEPNILIIDEALAVGDAYFQQKCFRRIEEFRNKGGTLLFVSHDASTIKHICSRAILLDKGTVLRDATPKEVIDLYEALIAQKSDLSDQSIKISQDHDSGSNTTSSNTPQPWSKASTIVTNQDATLIDFKLKDADLNEVKHLESEKKLTVCFSVRLNKTFERPAYGLIIRDRIGRSIFETSTYAMKMEEKTVTRNTVVKISFTFDFNLKEGQYSFSIGVANKGFSKSEFEEYSLLMHDVAQLNVVSCDTAIHYGGVFNMNPLVNVEFLETLNENA